MREMQESYSLPALSDTLAHLNKFGAIIVGSLYFVIVAIIIIFLVHKLLRKFLIPRLLNKRFAFVLIFTLYALVLVAATLLVLSRMGFDISLIARVSLLLVVVVAALIFIIAPYLPALPFKLGDMVELSGLRGNIESIKPVFTRVQTFDGRTHLDQKHHQLSFHSDTAGGTRAQRECRSQPGGRACRTDGHHAQRTPGSGRSATGRTLQRGHGRRGRHGRALLGAKRRFPGCTE
jgi:hypothetical protein